MEDNNNVQNNPVNNAGSQIPAQPVMYQQPGVQQVYYTRPVMPVPNGYGIYAQPAQPVQPVQPLQPLQPVQPVMPVQQARPYQPGPAVPPAPQAPQTVPVQQKAEQKAVPEQKTGDGGSNGKRSIVMPLIFSIALALVFLFSLAQSFYIASLNKKITQATATSETTSETEESKPEESTETVETEEPTETVESGNRKVLSTTEIVAAASPATVPVFVCKGEKKVSGGTGFIISKEGYIVTNSHVVKNAVKSPDDYHVIVLLPDNDEQANAEIVGVDDQNDIAVLKVQTSKTLPCLTFGDSDKLQSGELVIAIGNALGQLDDTVTVGVVSGTNRTITSNGHKMRVIQTDAAINNGNSGGPLLNSYGEVVGITNAKIVTSTSEGLGFAIPVNSIKGIIDTLINYGKDNSRPFLGFSAGSVKTDPDHIYVASLVSGGPAEKAGLKVGDMIISLDGVEIVLANDIIVVRDSHKIGDAIECVVERDGTRLTFTIIIGNSKDFISSDSEKPTLPSESETSRRRRYDDGESDD